MVKGKRGGARPGAGRKPRVKGKIEHGIVEEAIKSMIQVGCLDRLQAACARGEYLSLLEVARLYDRTEQQILRARGATRISLPPDLGDLFESARR